MRLSLACPVVQLTSLFFDDFVWNPESTSTKSDNLFSFIINLLLGK